MHILRNALNIGLIFLAPLHSARALTFFDWQYYSFTEEQLGEEGVVEANVDPDGDGVPNLHEYVFGGHPLHPEAGITPTLELVNTTLALTYRERHGMEDVSIDLQGSDTLVNWITYNSVVEADRVTFTDHDEVTLLDPALFDNNSRRFLRLRVELLPAIEPRPPERVRLSVITPTFWSVVWTDPNTTETGHAVERRLPTSVWQRVGTTGPDTGVWQDMLADYQTSTTYRVVAVGDGIEAPSSPVTLPDTDGDGIPDALELGGSYSGIAGTFASDPNSFSSNESGLGDGWMVSNGFDPVAPFDNGADSDGDGLTDRQEALRGTNIDEPDTDGDGVLDGADSWPRDAWITAPRLPEVRYVVVPLTQLGWPSGTQQFAVSENMKLFGRAIASSTPPVTYEERHFSLVDGDSHGHKTPGSLIWPTLYLLTSPYKVYPTGNPSFLFDARGGHLLGGVNGLFPQPFRLAPDGRYLMAKLEEDDEAMSAALFDTDGNSQIIDFAEDPPGISAVKMKGSMAYAANRQGDVTTLEYAGSVEEDNQAPMGWFHAKNYIAGYIHQADGTKVRMGDWAIFAYDNNMDGSDPATYSNLYFEAQQLNNERIAAGILRDPKPLSESPYRLSIWREGNFTDLPNQTPMREMYLSDATPGIPVIVGGNQSNGFNIFYLVDDIWTDSELRVWNKKTQQAEKLTSARINSNRMEFLTHNGRRIVRNGVVEDLDGNMPKDWSLFSSSYLNNHGVIAASVRRTIDETGNEIPESQQSSEPALLLPASFIVSNDTPVPYSRPLDVFTDTVAGPRITLEPITTSDVTVSNGIASVTISGEIIDAPMGTIPPDQGGDISEVVVYLNGSETNIRGTVMRKAAPATLWAPYGDKATIAPLMVSFPASGVVNIEIATSPNALGLSGRAGFEVSFNDSSQPPSSMPGISYSSDLLISSPFSKTVIDSIQVTDPDALTGETLVETAVDSRVFTNTAKTASFTLYSQFLTDVQVTDSIKGRLSGISDFPTSSGWDQITDEGTETTTGSGRFRFTVTRAPTPQPRLASWQLHSVAMHPKVEASPVRPIGFSAAPIESLNLSFVGEEFAVSKVSGHADQSSAFAVTAPNKPLMGFMALRDEDPEDPDSGQIREFVYYDHAEGAVVRRTVNYVNGNLPWSLEIGSTDPVTVSHKTRGKTVDFVDATGQLRPGFLPIEIDNIRAYLDNENGVEIEEDAVFFIELSGYSAGEVARVFSGDAPDDYFDLVMPGADSLVEPYTTKNAVLAEPSTGIFRTAQKVVVYSTPGDSAQRLTTSEWDAFKSRGYLAIHNSDITIVSKESMEAYLREMGMDSIHPDADQVLGVTKSPGSKSATAYRFKGFEDHHVFNAYHENEIKSARWNKIFGTGWRQIFGDDFDVDEFTVPVHKRTHRKMGPAITNKWETFLNQYFDGNGNLLPNVNRHQLRKNTIDEMYAICAEFKIDTSKMRIWPGVIGKPEGSKLVTALVETQGELGKSANKLQMMKNIADQFADDATKLAAARKGAEELKKASKRVGRRKAVRLLPFVGLAITAATTTKAAVDYHDLGWEEALAQQVNDYLSLDDIELARETVRFRFSNTHIAGGTPQLSLQVNPTQILALGQRSYRVWHGMDNKVNTIARYALVEIKVFPGGTTKVAWQREDSPEQVDIIENTKSFIDDYWPSLEDPMALHFEAQQRARAKE